jgi:cysteine desulfurase / selenocysteine lyase
MALDIAKIREDFPVLHQMVNNKPLVYFDNAATSQKPTKVIEALSAYYLHDNANIHRGIHTLAERATKAYEQTREAVKSFINAASTQEIIFTSGTTQGINLVANTYAKAFLQKGDAILISAIEHHSNIVPWQMIAQEKGLLIKVIPVLDSGDLDQEAYKKLLTPEVKLVAVNHVSNALGTINPVKEMIRLAHANGAKILIDGAQSCVHFTVDVQDLDADFYVFSAHKIYGPTGIGILYGKQTLLDAMPPYQGGGEMIKEVSFEGTTYNELPYKFEAGTPNIADVVAFKAAIDYTKSFNANEVAQHEIDLTQYATQQLKTIEGLRIIGEAKEKVSVVSFVIDGVHHHDLGVLLDNMGIAVRTGHHCTQPLMKRFGIEGTTRASFAVYNTKEEIDMFIAALNRCLNMLL